MDEVNRFHHSYWAKKTTKTSLNTTVRSSWFHLYSCVSMIYLYSPIQHGDFPIRKLLNNNVFPRFFWTVSCGKLRHWGHACEWHRAWYCLGCSGCWWGNQTEFLIFLNWIRICPIKIDYCIFDNWILPSNWNRTDGILSYWYSYWLYISIPQYTPLV